MMRWDEEVDLVCIGSGIAGCAAAVTGAGLGLKVALLEKSKKLGGTTTWSYGIVWLGNSHHALAKGIVDSAEETRAYLDYLGGGRNDPEVTASFVDNSPKALRFFEDAAKVPFYLVDGLPDHYYPLGDGSKPKGRSHQVRPFETVSLGSWQRRLESTPYGHGRVTFEEMAAWGGRAGYRQWDHEVIADREAKDVRTFGGALAGYFLKAVLDRGIPIVAECRAERLLVEDGRVVGVVVEAEGGARTIRALRGVVIASGLYDGNPRLMSRFDEFNAWPPRGAPRNEGDGLVMALEIGSAFAVMHWNLSLKLGYHVEGETIDGRAFMRSAGSREVAYPHSFLVNRKGKRFADESSFGDVATKLRHFDAFSHALVNVPCYLIFDSQYLAKYGLPPLPPGTRPPEWLARAGAIGELADCLGIDRDGLVATVERFNGFAAEGQDADFGRGSLPWSRQAAGDLTQKNPNLGPVVEAPFFGLKMHPIEGNSVGLLTDGNGQIIHLRGQPIPGLYACGEVAAWLHVGVGYQAGLSLAGGMTFGWLAAQHAAGKTLAG